MHNDDADADEALSENLRSQLTEALARIRELEAKLTECRCKVKRERVKKPSMRKCSSCNVRCECTFDSNPYAHEIHGDDTKVWMCAECRYQSAMDI